MREPEHKFDVLDEGDEIPFRGDYAEVIVRTVVEDLPGYLPSWAEPGEFDPPERDEFDADYVLLTIDTPDGESHDATVTGLIKHLGESHDPFGLPGATARARDALSAAGGARITVTKPASTNKVDAETARALADFLREHADFEPLYALLNDVESPDDVAAFADGLERAAHVVTVAERVED